jgi:hypothetical protein
LVSDIPAGDGKLVNLFYGVAASVKAGKSVFSAFYCKQKVITELVLIY